jgi:hypothetical protein
VATVLVYNGKTITLPRPPQTWNISAGPPSTVFRSRTGVVKTTLAPRVDCFVHAEFNAIPFNLRLAVDNWWTWAQEGNAFRLNFDDAHTVSTTLNGTHGFGTGSGTYTLLVTSATGIVAGRQYVIRGGPHYQLVTVTNVSGLDVTIDTVLDFDFPGGSLFRERYMWDLILRDSAASSPIIETFDAPNTFYLTIDAHEQPSI